MTHVVHDMSMQASLHATVVHNDTSVPSGRTKHTQGPEDRRQLCRDTAIRSTDTSVQGQMGKEAAGRQGFLLRPGGREQEQESFDPGHRSYKGPNVMGPASWSTKS